MYLILFHLIYTIVVKRVSLFNFTYTFSFIVYNPQHSFTNIILNTKKEYVEIPDTDYSEQHIHSDRTAARTLHLVTTRPARQHNYRDGLHTSDWSTGQRQYRGNTEVIQRHPLHSDHPLHGFLALVNNMSYIIILTL